MFREDVFACLSGFDIVFLTLICINFILNNFFFKNINRFRIPESITSDPPLVSILVPARNKEANIKRCIHSLRKQDYPNFEILILDDNSEDFTSSAAEKAMAADERVRLIKGKPLPKGWIGKNYACWQLARHARGSYLLFTDADTLHFKKSVSGSLAAMINENMDTISVLPSQIMVTFHERMVVSFINFAFLCLLPLSLMKRSRNPLFAAGNGQFLFFKKETYEAVGGHKSVKDRIIEDVSIIKLVKGKGFRVMVYDGRQEVYCRMYRNLEQVV